LIDHRTWRGDLSWMLNSTLAGLLWWARHHVRC
jgi:hypothetical protein